jgi:hypothetical protein
MDKIIQFPVQKKPILEKAYFSHFPSKVCKGADITVEIFGKLHAGIVNEILGTDQNNNVKVVSYIIPHLSSDDPLKIGKANFSYIIKKHE